MRVAVQMVPTGAQAVPSPCIPVWQKPGVDLANAGSHLAPPPSVPTRTRYSFSPRFAASGALPAGTRSAGVYLNDAHYSFGPLTKIDPTLHCSDRRAGRGRDRGRRGLGGSTPFCAPTTPGGDPGGANVQDNSVLHSPPGGSRTSAPGPRSRTCARSTVRTSERSVGRQPLRCSTVW